jgi:hypothetical protein
MNNINDLEKLLTPEMKGMFTELSTKFANTDTEGSEGGGLIGLLQSGMKAMEEEPDLLKNTFSKITETFSENKEISEGMENMNMPAMIQQVMRTFGMGGGAGGSSNVEETEQQKKIEDKKYIEKHITIAVNAEELEIGKTKKFRFKVKPEDEEKQLFQLKLEPDVYAYQFWEKTKDGEDILIRVGVEEIVKDVLE